MRKIEMNAKKNQNQNKLDELLEKCFAHYERAAERGSTGNHGAEYEVIVRQLLLARGTKDAFVQSRGKTDLRIKIAGHWRRIEIKTGSGIVGNVPVKLNDKIGAHSESEILPNMDLVIYSAEPKAFDGLDDVLDNSLVLTREEFIAFAIATSGKRKHEFATAFKMGVNNGALRKANRERKESGVDGRYTDCITLQTIYNDNRAQAIKDNFEYTTLRDVLMELGR